jgi:anti-sigma regulatory factor (Ser/Thr protein kinase)
MLRAGRRGVSATFQMPGSSPAADVLMLDRTIDAPRVARTRMRQIVADLGEERGDDAVLLVSELVTNAVKYGGDGPIELVVERDAGRARFAVRDHGGTGRPLPEMRAPGLSGGGHGLRLVDEIADRWGVEHGSTIVWFEFDLG